jgi:CRP-like cAMP-binding protein
VRRKVYKPGEVIVRQDDRTDDVYFVIEGRCEVGPDALYRDGVIFTTVGANDVYCGPSFLLHEKVLNN